MPQLHPSDPDRAGPERRRKARQRVPSGEQTPAGSSHSPDPISHLAEGPTAGDFTRAAFERHAALLGNSRLSDPRYSHERAAIVQQLQSAYGNSYVQLLVDHVIRTRTTEGAEAQRQPEEEERVRLRRLPVQSPLPWPAIQRETKAKVSNPLAEALGAATTQAARNQLGEQVFQVLNRLKLATLAPLLHLPNTVALLQTLVANLGTLDADRLAAIIDTLSPHMSGPAIAALAPAQADFLVRHVANIQLAQNALVTAQNDAQQAEAIMGYLTPYIGDASAVQLAQSVLASVQNDVPQATAIMGYLAPYIAAPASLKVAQDVLASVQNNVQQARAQMDFLKDYVALGDKVLGLAREEYARAAGDADKAKAEMTTLAKYNYDRELRGGAEQAATQVAEEEAAKTREAAAQAKQEAYKSATASIPQRPKQKASKAKKKEYEDAKQQADDKKKQADEKERQAIEQAEQGQEATRARALGETEKFIASASKEPAIGEDHARWIIEATKFRVDLADVIAGWFKIAASVGADSRVTSAWLLTEAGSDAGTLGKAASYLGEALGQQLALPLAQSFTRSLMKFDPTPQQTTRLAQDASDCPDDWPKVVGFIEPHASKMDTALDLLEKARAANIAIDELVAFVGKRSIADVNWVLEQTRNNLAAAETAFDLLGKPKITKGNVKKLAWLLTMSGRPIFNKLVQTIEYREEDLDDVEEVFTFNAAHQQYPDASLTGWISLYGAKKLSTTLQATTYEVCEKFVELFIGYGAKPEDPEQLLSLIRLDALLATPPVITLRVYQPDVNYAGSQDPPSRTGFLDYRFANGDRAIIHTHWNVTKKKLVSMHIQDLSGNNGLEINQWKWFARVQQAVRDGHNASTTYPPTTDPPGGSLTL